jgi:hypothetical protein
VKFINFKRLEQPGFIVLVNKNTENRNGWIIPRKKIRGKTTTKKRRHRKELLAAEYKREEDARRGQGYLEAKY